MDCLVLEGNAGVDHDHVRGVQEKSVIEHLSSKAEIRRKTPDFLYYSLYIPNGYGVSRLAPEAIINRIPNRNPYEKASTSEKECSGFWFFKRFLRFSMDKPPAL